MIDNRDYMAWLNNNWNYLDRVEFLFKRKWTDLDEWEKKKIVKCLIEHDRKVLEHYLDELGV